MLTRFQKLLGGRKATQRPAPADAVPDLPRPAATTYVIGDVHGRRDLLELILELIDAHIGGTGSNDPQLVFVGDYVDRGPESADVLRRLQALDTDFPNNLTCLMGNHERMLLDFLQDPATRGPRWIRAGGGQTLWSFAVRSEHLDATSPARDWKAAADALQEACGEALLDWIADLPLSWSSGNLWVTHAGADPSRAMPDQSTRVLLWGHPEFDSAPRGDNAWIAHGHTVVDYPVFAEGRIATDTGAWFSDQLTACAIKPDGSHDFLQT